MTGLSDNTDRVPSPNEDYFLSPHFTLRELWCPCCHGVHLTNLRRLCARLELVRSAYGPMEIASAYRCAMHNHELGGKFDSRHLDGLAADIKVCSDSDRYRLMQALLANGFRRIGVMKNAIHADIGESLRPVLWTYYP